MTIGVLEQKVGVEYLRISKHAEHLVETVSLVNQLVPCQAIDACHVPPHESKDCPLGKRITLAVFKKVTVTGLLEEGVLADYAETPDPS